MFSADDTLYVRVVAPGVDVTAVENSTVELTPVGDGESFSVPLSIDLEAGAFTSAVALADLVGNTRNWRVAVNIDAVRGASFQTQTDIVITGRTPESEVVRISGVVSAASDAEITVGGQTVRITDQTAVTAVGEGNIAPSDLVGRTVDVVAQRDAEGNLEALAVTARSTSSNTIELSGPITAVTFVPDTTITVGSVTVRLDAATQFEGTGDVASIGALTTGTRVDVEALRTGDGYLATSVRVQNRTDGDDDETDEIQTVRGTIDEVGETFIVLDGLRIEVTGDTEFEGAANLGALTAGTTAEVRFAVRTDGTIEAIRIEVDDDANDDEEEVEAEGTITLVTDSQIAIDGILFTIDGDTRITADGGLQISLGDLFAGLHAEVEGVRRADGTVVARRISVDDFFETSLEVSGTLSARTDTTLTVNGTTFSVTSNTEIEAERGASMTLDQIEVGMFLEADLVRRADGVLVATRIEVEAPFETDDIRVTGRIQSVASNAIEVGGVTFVVNGQTRVSDQQDRPVSLGSLVVGQVVRVEGFIAEDSSRVATDIETRGRLHREGTLTGPITAIQGRTIDVSGLSVRVGPRTEFDGVADLAALQVGQNVDIRFRVLGDDTRAALVVELADANANVSLSGTIDDVTGDGIVIASVPVRLTAGTTIVGDGGATLTAGDLEVGQRVDVDATAGADGLEATRIEVVDALVLSASVESMSGNTIRLPGLDVLVTGETVILGPNGELLSLADIAPGAFVEVILGVSTTTDGPAYTADRILVEQAAAGTGVEPETGSDLPASFVLEGNYPNPFNPSTNIRFELRQAGNVTLSVYNTLGQKVATLVDRALGAGRHEYTWNGLDAQGRPAASGIYLYRLEMGDRAETRTMTLVK